jgi:hypothetical protein
MNTKNIKYLSYANLIGLFLTVILSFYLMLFIPSSFTLFANRDWVDNIVSNYKTLEDFREFLKRMVESVSSAQNTSVSLFKIVFFVNFLLFAIFSINLIFTRKLKKSL